MFFFNFFILGVKALLITNASTHSIIPPVCPLALQPAIVYLSSIASTNNWGMCYYYPHQQLTTNATATTATTTTTTATTNPERTLPGLDCPNAILVAVSKNCVWTSMLVVLINAQPCKQYHSSTLNPAHNLVHQRFFIHLYIFFLTLVVIELHEVQLVYAKLLT